MWRTLPSHEDAISAVRFAPGGADLVLSTSWDATLAVSDPAQEQFALRVPFRAPLLAGVWAPDGNAAYAAGLERRIATVDLATQKVWDIGGDHTAPISALAVSEQAGAVFAGSYDGALQAVDARAETGVFYRAPAKILSLDAAGPLLIAGLAGRDVVGYDVRKLSEPLFERKMHHTHPLRTVRAMPKGTGYAVASLLSRVTIEAVPGSARPGSSPNRRGPLPAGLAGALPAPLTDFSFRSNRRRKPSGDEDGSAEFEAYPINALAFHPTAPVLATGGSDQTVQVWDFAKKQKVTEYTQLPYAVTQLDYSPDGRFLAVGLHDDRWRTSPLSMPAPKASATLLIKRLDASDV